MLIDAEHGVQTQDGTIVDSLQMDMVDELDLLDCYDNHGDLQSHNNDPKCKTAEWMLHSEEDLEETSTFPSSLDSLGILENLTGFGGGTGNACNLSQEFDANVLSNQESHFHHNQINYSMNYNNILEGSRIEPCMRMNGKEDGLSAMDGVVSSHRMFSSLENQLDSQSKRIHYDIWEQQPLKSSHKNYSSPETEQYLMMQDNDIRNADKNIENLNQTGSGLQCPIMCCLEGFCYHKGESCFYSKFRGNQSSHNFEGVARSFPATLHKIHPTPIPTPPLDDDWLFSNIVAEEEVNCMSNTFGKYRSVTGP